MNNTKNPAAVSLGSSGGKKSAEARKGKTDYKALADKRWEAVRKADAERLAELVDDENYLTFLNFLHYTGKLGGRDRDSISFQELQMQRDLYLEEYQEFCKDHGFYAEVTF